MEDQQGKGSGKIETKLNSSAFSPIWSNKKVPKEELPRKHISCSAINYKPLLREVETELSKAFCVHQFCKLPCVGQHGVA